MRKIKLICIPYAGGSAQVYKNWNKYLDSTIEIIPIELAGRGKRFLELRYENMEKAVDDVYKMVKPLIQNTEYAVFGHSMGSILTYELLHRIKNDNLCKPMHAFFSGTNPPYAKKITSNIHDAPLDIFVNEIEKLGGTPKTILENKDFLDVFIPILRADYKIIETYNCMNQNSKFDFDISVLNGNKDRDIEDKNLQLWQTCTLGTCRNYKFEGGHFFIQERTEEVVKLVYNILNTHKF
jgi:surfactin synthase thioesterase subunit